MFMTTQQRVLDPATWVELWPHRKGWCPLTHYKMCTMHDTQHEHVKKVVLDGCGEVGTTKMLIAIIIISKEKIVKIHN
jgi:hypothetical protein